MAKSKRKSPKKKDVNPVAKSEKHFNSWIWGLVVFAIAILLYSNTLSHEYTQDDAIVIYDNIHVQQGISGIPAILSNDSFHGFFKEDGKDKLVPGGRYRPMSMLMFAVGWQLWGENPFVGHLINVLLFGCLCVLIFLTLQRFGSKHYGPELALLSAVIFACHPIHTEVVANIKGRDEILSMMGAIGALYFMINATDNERLSNYLLAAVSFFIGLMSKENAITFLAVIPLALWLFRDVDLISAIKRTGILLIPVILFLVIRGAVIGWSFGSAPMELMNNPFLRFDGDEYVALSFIERLPTVIYILGKYVALLFFPHPLTHDYYPRYIDLYSFADISVWLALLMYASMTVFAWRYWGRHRILSFGILYFLCTISIVSNIFFPIGTNLSERFLFMSSLGFCMILSAGIMTLHQLSRRIPLALTGMLILCGLMSAKTIDRNKIWKDDYTLFTTDVLVSKQSAKVNNAAAGAIATKYYNHPDEAVRTSMIHKAEGYAQQAIRIHPLYKNAYLLAGNCNHYLKQYEKAEELYQKALEIDPGASDVQLNLAINDREAGRYYGEVKSNLAKAMRYLKRALIELPEDYETNRLLGVASGMMGKHMDAARYFEIAADQKPDLAVAWRNVSTAYFAAGDDVNGTKYLRKSEALENK